MEWRVPSGEVVGEIEINRTLQNMYNQKNSALSLEAEQDAFLQHKINVKIAIQPELDRQKEDVRKRSESQDQAVDRGAPAPSAAALSTTTEKMPAKQPPLRVDPADCIYPPTRVSFLEFLIPRICPPQRLWAAQRHPAIEREKERQAQKPVPCNDRHPVPEDIRKDREKAARWWLGKRIVKKVQRTALLSRY